MSELRWDPLKQRWVIIAPERSRRPRDFFVKEEEKRASSCPFCYGNEDKTPPEIFAIRPDGPPNSPNWQVRVVPNKYPALRVEDKPNSRGYGLYDVMNGVGAHEVIIETPDHNRSMADLTEHEISHILQAYRARYLDLCNDVRLRYIVIFKNHGAGAGASLQHSHSQLIAVPLMPPVATTELTVARNYFHKKERCIFCDIIEFELNAGERVAREFPNYLIIAPYASSSPFELRLFPKKHCHDFAMLDNAQISELAAAMRDMLLRIKLALNDAPYNFILHTAPPPHRRPGKSAYWESLEYDYHWHIELVPRLTQVAGFEWGTGFFINPVSPEDAARFLRETQPE